MRDTILQALRQSNYVSGEELGHRLHRSRTAIWKHIGQLRSRGYDIRSSPGLGYTLVAAPDLLFPEEITSGLNTKVMGRRIEYLAQIGSTQDEAKRRAAEGAQEGTIVIAEHQTSGRGRLGRSWVSPPGTNISLSILLRPNLKPVETAQIPLIAGIATAKAIERTTDVHPRIKWPNDLLVEGKKVAGLLAEMAAEIDRLHYIVLGIGINVNTTSSDFPPEVRPIALSLAQASGCPVSRVKLVQALLEEFEVIYDAFQQKGFSFFRNEWKTYDCTIGSWVTASLGIEQVEGLALDIDETGALVLQKADGEIEKILAGDVTLGRRSS